MRILGGKVFVLLLATTAFGVPVNPNPRENASHAPRDRSNKRMDIIYLQGDISKRSRKQEPMASMEKHGKSLTAEGRMAKKTPEGHESYEDVKEYHRSSFEVLSADKAKGPAGSEDAGAAKSDAFEVVNEDGNGAEKSLAREDNNPILEPSVTSKDAANQVSVRKPHEKGAGFHIVSLDTDERPEADKDDRPPPPKHSYQDEDVYGTIESRPVALPGQGDRSGSDGENRVSTPNLQNSETRHYSQDNDDFIPSSVVSLGEQDILPFAPGSDIEREMYDLPRLEHEGGFDPRLTTNRPYRFEESSYWPRAIRRPRFRERYIPWPREQPEGGHFPSQRSLGAYGGNSGYPRRPYADFDPDEGARKQLISQSAFSLPFAQAQTSSLMQAPVDDPRFPVAQSPITSAAMFQMQPIPQAVPSFPFVASESGPLMMQAPQQLVAPFVQQQALPATLPRSRWVDSPGYSRDEVPDYNPRKEDEMGRDNEDEPEDETGESRSREEDEEDSDDERGEEEFSRVEPETHRNDEQRDYEERGRDDEGEGSEPVREEYREEGAAQRSRDPYENGEDGESDEDIPHESISERPGSFQDRPYASDRHEQGDFPDERSSFTDPLNEQRPGSFLYQRAFRQYPYRLREFHRNMYQRFAPARPRMEVSQMSASQARFQENKERRDPLEYFGPVSKNTIPGKLTSAKTGLENVLIKLNGKNLEDAAELRSKIIDGKIVQGKGKVIKSKGPVDVKISHTNDAKHTKIINIISPQNYTVYDTKSKIAKPSTG